MADNNDANSTERFLGTHVYATGGLASVIERANRIGMNSVQGMFSTPMRWRADAISSAEVEAMGKATIGTTVKKILFHGIYLINLARQEKQKFHMSKLSLLTHLDAAHELQATITQNGGDAEVLGVTFHPGSAIDCTPEEGVKRIAQGLDWVVDQTPGSAMILLESSAGSGNVLGDQLEELGAMREATTAKSQVGYVLDTEHMFVSGYDWRENLEGIVNQIDSILGLENVKAFHLNDSKVPFNSHKDRHENLGAGEIGEEAIKGIINHPKLRNIPFICETPILEDEAGITAEFEKLKSWAK